MHGKHEPADEAEALIYKLETWRPFADILGVYFTRQNMQQQALAACAGSSNPSVSYWLRGERLPTIDTLYKLGTCLGCDIQQQRNLLAESKHIEEKTDQDIDSNGLDQHA